MIMADEPKEELQHLAFEDRIEPELRAIRQKLDAIERQLDSVLQAKHQEEGSALHRAQ